MTKFLKIIYSFGVLLLLSGIAFPLSAAAETAVSDYDLSDYNNSLSSLKPSKKKAPGQSYHKIYKKKIFIDDSASLFIEEDLDDYNVSFKSSNPDRLTVNKISNNSCEYTGVSAGTAHIIVKIKSRSGLFFMSRTKTIKAKVSVAPRAVSVRFRKSKYRMAPGQKKRIRTTLRPSITTERPVYTSLNPEIVTFSKKGVLRAKTPGITYVTASISNGMKVRCKIIVKKKADIKKGKISIL